MRVNIYAEEMTDRIEIIAKVIDGRPFTGLRFYLELPATVNGQQYRGPFMHRPGDDDSSAVTFWGKRDLRVVLRKALTELDRHYAESASPPRVPVSSAHPVRAGVESGPGQPITYTTAREQDRAEGFRDGIDAAAMAARGAKLPDGYIWGRDALEQFDFGKQRAEAAILALADGPIEDRFRAGVEAAEMAVDNLLAQNGFAAEYYAGLHSAHLAIRALADAPAPDPLLTGVGHVRKWSDEKGQYEYVPTPDPAGLQQAVDEIAKRGGTKGG